MATPFIIGRVKGDHPVRGKDDTVTRIYYQSPPPRTAITSDNDDSGLSSRKLVYEDRGVTGVLQTALYPKSKTLTLLSRESLGKPVVRYEPKHTPPDCFEAQDYALQKAEILLRETERADKQARLAKAPRRDSAVSEDDESELQTTLPVPESQDALATSAAKAVPSSTKPQKAPVTTIRSQESKIDPTITPRGALATPQSQDVSATTSPQEAVATIEPPEARPSTEPHIIITTTEPLENREDELRGTSKRRKLSSSPRSSSPAQQARVQPPKSRAPSESRFAKPKTPPAPTVTAPTARGESVVSVRSNASNSSRRSRGSRAIKDDLTIDSNFGLEKSNELQYKDKKGNWYDAIGEGRPSWAVEERQKVPTVRPEGRRSTGAWRAST